jgi:hypothetical protein
MAEEFVLMEGARVKRGGEEVTVKSSVRRNVNRVLVRVNVMSVEMGFI